MEANIPIIVMTTKISTSVNPDLRCTTSMCALLNIAFVNCRKKNLPLDELLSEKRKIIGLITKIARQVTVSAYWKR